MIVPTYNERDNLTRLLPALLAVQANLEVIVVDDGSPDGTAEIAEEFARTTGRVHLLQRGGRHGYASAVQDGLRYGLSSGAELFVQMDADFSHHPKHVPALLRLSDKECDVAIGSRYVPGGGTRNWSLYRRLLSAGANTVVRWTLDLPTRDSTGGFRCYRRPVVEESGLLNLKIEGYAFLLATMHLIQQQGWAVREMPIVFVDREFGRSKLSKRIIAEAGLVSLRLALRRFGILG